MSSASAPPSLATLSSPTTTTAPPAAAALEEGEVVEGFRLTAVDGKWQRRTTRWDKTGWPTPHLERGKVTMPTVSSSSSSSAPPSLATLIANATEEGEVTDVTPKEPTATSQSSHSIHSQWLSPHLTRGPVKAPSPKSNSTRPEADPEIKQPSEKKKKTAKLSKSKPVHEPFHPPIIGHCETCSIGISKLRARTICATCNKMWCGKHSDDHDYDACGVDEKSEGPCCDHCWESIEGEPYNRCIDCSKLWCSHACFEEETHWCEAIHGPEPKVRPAIKPTKCSQCDCRLTAQSGKAGCTTCKKLWCKSCSDDDSRFDHDFAACRAEEEETRRTICDHCWEPIVGDAYNRCVDCDKSWCSQKCFGEETHWCGAIHGPESENPKPRPKKKKRSKKTRPAVAAAVARDSEGESKEEADDEEEEAKAAAAKKIDVAVKAASAAHQAEAAKTFMAEAGRLRKDSALYDSLKTNALFLAETRKLLVSGVVAMEKHATDDPLRLHMVQQEVNNSIDAIIRASLLVANTIDRM